MLINYNINEYNKKGGYEAMWWIAWLIVAIIFAVAEIIYSGFFLLWFSVGALCSMLVSFIFPNSIFLQCIVFLVVSIILLLTLTKRLTKKYTKEDTTPTNVDKLVGKTGVVIQNIGEDTYESGLVKLNGETWSAVSHNGTPIAKGTSVKV